MFDTLSDALNNLGDWFGTNTCLLLTRHSTIADRLDHRGSGVCVNIQGLKVIITANHVLGDNPKENFFVPIVSNTKTRSVPLVGTCLVSAPAQALRDNSDSIDIGYFILSPSTYNQLKAHYSFITYPIIDPDHIVSNRYRYCLSGIPKSKFISHKFDKTYTLVQFHTSLADNGGYKKGITKDTHIVVQRTRKITHPETGQKMIAPKLDGASGGGLWVIKDDFTVIGDNGNIQLVGIFIMVDGAYYICTRLDQVLYFMKGNRFHVDLNYKYDEH